MSDDNSKQNIEDYLSNFCDSEDLIEDLSDLDDDSNDVALIVYKKKLADVISEINPRARPYVCNVPDTYTSNKKNYCTGKQFIDVFLPMINYVQSLSKNIEIIVCYGEGYGTYDFVSEVLNILLPNYHYKQAVEINVKEPQKTETYVKILIDKSTEFRSF